MSAQQCQTNWEYREVLVFIKCKEVEYITQKELVDPRTHMVFYVQRWTKIVDRLQNKINAWVPQNSKTCKDKYNDLHLNYKKYIDYHKGTSHDTSYQELVVDECDKLHLPRQFNYGFYKVIYGFQGERSVNKLIHVRDLQVYGDANYIASIVDSQENQELAQPQWTFMQEILSDDYVTNEQIANNGNDTVSIRVNVVNLDDFSRSTHHHEVSFVNLLNTQSRQQATKKLLTTLITLRST